MDNQSHLASNIIEIYKKHGRAWTALRGQHLYEKGWLDQFLALLPQQAEILDLGHGSGKTDCGLFNSARALHCGGGQLRGDD